MFLIFLEIHAQFRLTWTPTHTSEWRVIRWLWMFTSGEQLARMHGLAEWTKVTVLSDLTSDLSCSKFRPIEVTWGWNQVKDMHHKKGSLCLGNHKCKWEIFRVWAPELYRKQNYNMTIQTNWWSSPDNGPGPPTVCAESLRLWCVCVTAQPDLT